MLCRNCLGALEYAFSRKRGRRYTAEEGPAVETAIVAVCRCPEDGSYSTVYESDIVRNKQYCLGDIRSVLENKADYCLASPRTRSYWRSWFCKVWASVVEKIHRHIGSNISECDISSALSAFLKGCGESWLRYVLDLFSPNPTTFASSSTSSALRSAPGARICREPSLRRVQNGASRPGEDE
jgi:hypothetical protein